jgi:redox-sensing transcriptional repressor
MVNKKCIARLSEYRKALIRHAELGMVKVFSDTLAEAVGVTPAQVRKDFSLFGIAAGNKKGGYRIDELVRLLGMILGKDQVQDVVVAGVGQLGGALIRYSGFEREGIRVAAGFDTDTAKINRKAKVPILPLGELKEFVKSRDIRVGVLAVPESAAQEVFDLMVSAGILGLLNFTPVRFHDVGPVVVNHVNLEIELENVLYFLHAMTHTQLTGDRA